MEVSSKHQLFVFVIYIIAGIGCGVFFDVQRSLRKIFSAGKMRTLFEDFLFASVCIAGAIVAGLLCNRGQMRYYQVMGLISGVLFYAAFLSSFTVRILTKICRILKKLIIKPVFVAVGIIVRPFVGFYLYLKKFYSSQKIKMSRVLRRFKVGKKKLKKRMKML